MKALKNDSTIYTQNIVSAIHDCYEKNNEPTNTKLMELYSFVGQCICEQGEKAFVVHLAQALTEQFPQIKGFSPRNFRRMRDFYRSYESCPELMRKALTLSWTQNTVILDSCKADEQQAFYMTIAIEQSLSKLVLMKAIEVVTFGTALSADTAQDTVATVRPAVTDCTSEQGVDTTSATEQPCGAFVTVCEPLRQGSNAPSRSDGVNHEKCKQKRRSRPTPKRSAELLPFGIDYLFDACRLWLTNGCPPGKSPPHRWCHFRTHERRMSFA